MADEYVAKVGLTLDSSQLEQGLARGVRSFADIQAASMAAGVGMDKFAGYVQYAAKSLFTAFSAYKLIELTKASIDLASRYEELGVVMQVVGNGAGWSMSRMKGLTDELQKTGITMKESRQTVISFVQAQMDLSRASELARVAQNAAVTANLNSSETLNRIIFAIRAGRSEILRNIGLNVSFEESYRDLQKTLGHSLNEMEKQQARFNAVVKAGVPIQDAYTAAMETAAKQEQSSKRYLEDLQVKLGSLFLPVHTAGVFAYADALKTMQGHVEILAMALLALMARGLQPLLIMVGSKLVGAYQVFRIQLASTAMEMEGLTLAARASSIAMGILEGAMAFLKANWIFLALSALAALWVHNRMEALAAAEAFDKVNGAAERFRTKQQAWTKEQAVKKPGGDLWEDTDPLKASLTKETEKTIVGMTGLMSMMDKHAQQAAASVRQLAFQWHEGTITSAQFLRLLQDMVLAHPEYAKSVEPVIQQLMKLDSVAAHLSYDAEQAELRLLGLLPSQQETQAVEDHTKAWKEAEAQWARNKEESARLTEAAVYGLNAMRLTKDAIDAENRAASEAEKRFSAWQEKMGTASDKQVSLRVAMDTLKGPIHDQAVALYEESKALDEANTQAQMYATMITTVAVNTKAVNAALNEGTTAYTKYQRAFRGQTMPLGQQTVAMGDTSDFDAFVKKMQDGQVKVRDSSRETLQIFKSAVESTQQELGKMFADIFQKGIDGFQSFADAIKNIFITLVSQIAATMTIRALGIDQLLKGLSNGGYVGHNLQSGTSVNNKGEIVDATGKVVTGTGGTVTKLGFGGKGMTGQQQGFAGLGAGLMAGSLGASMGNSSGEAGAIGAMGGAAAGFALGGPIGAAVGGLVGLGSALFGFAKKAREEAERLKTAREAFTNALQGIVDSLTKRTDYAKALDSVTSQIKTALANMFTAVGGDSAKYADKLKAMSEETFRKLIADLEAAAARGYKLSASDQELIKKYHEAVALVQKEMLEAWRLKSEDLVVKKLQMTGRGDQASQLQQDLAHQAQMRELEMSGLKEINVAEYERIKTLLGEVQALEDAALAAAQLQVHLERSTDLQVRALRAQGHNKAADDAAFAQSQQTAMAQALADGWSVAEIAALAYAQSLEGVARATELARVSAELTQDLEVRTLRAQGKGPAADAMAFALGQQREMAQALKDEWTPAQIAALALAQSTEALTFAQEQAFQASQTLLGFMAGMAQMQAELATANGDTAAATTYAAEAERILLEIRIAQYRQDARALLLAGTISQTLFDEYMGLLDQWGAATLAASQAQRDATDAANALADATERLTMGQSIQERYMRATGDNQGADLFRLDIQQKDEWKKALSLGMSESDMAQLQFVQNSDRQAILDKYAPKVATAAADNNASLPSGISAQTVTAFIEQVGLLNSMNIYLREISYNTSALRATDMPAALSVGGLNYGGGGTGITIVVNLNGDETPQVIGQAILDAVDTGLSRRAGLGSGASGTVRVM
jgi:hypothetical protein